MKRYIYLFIILLVLLPLIPGVSMYSKLFAQAPSGTGTSGDPYLISSLSHLVWISDNSNHWDKYYKQTTDIDASASSDLNGGTGFMPIGTNATNYFSGIFDGRGFAIDGLGILLVRR